MKYHPIERTYYLGTEAQESPVLTVLSFVAIALLIVVTLTII